MFDFIFKIIIQKPETFISTLVTLLATMITICKFIFTYPNKRDIKNLVLVKTLFSRDELTNLKKESNFIQHLTCNAVPFFKGIALNDIEKLINLNFSNKNYYIVFSLYRKNLIKVKNKTLILTEKAESLVKYGAWLKVLFTILFFIWGICVTLFLAKYFPLPMSIQGWILLIISIGIPEFSLLIYLDNLKNLKKFKSQIGEKHEPKR